MCVHVCVCLCGQNRQKACLPHTDVWINDKRNMFVLCLCVYMCPCLYVHVCVHVCVHACVCACMCVCMHVCVHSCVCACV